jgi:hypothetical protein
MGTKTLRDWAWLSNTASARSEPWSVERTLHLGLAGIVILGWTVAYAALTRGVPQDIARGENGGTKVTASLAPPQMPSPGRR